MDFVVVAKVAVVAILPNVASVGIEERVVTPAIRELDSGEVSLRHGGLGLSDWLQYDHRKKQSDEREDRLSVKVNVHVSTFKFPQIVGRPRFSIFDANGTESLQARFSFWRLGGPGYLQPDIETAREILVAGEPDRPSIERVSPAAAFHAVERRALIPNGKADGIPGVPSTRTPAAKYVPRVYERPDSQGVRTGKFRISGAAFASCLVNSAKRSASLSDDPPSLTSR
ncbi:MAG: hypothetical protein ACLQU1_44165 [Bryobacteraceae bacterium]